jgi:hypothetical protein
MGRSLFVGYCMAGSKERSHIQNCLSSLQRKVSDLVVNKIWAATQLVTQKEITVFCVSLWEVCIETSLRLIFLLYF